MKHQVIYTEDAPKAIGTYSQGIRVGDTIYISGQIPLNPATMEVAGDDMETQIRQVLTNVSAVAKAAGGGLDDIVKLNIYLTDLSHFPMVNQLMAEYFSEPYPARAAVGVAALPRDVGVEMEAVMVVD